jgi:hypothetical protein
MTDELPFRVVHSNSYDETLARCTNLPARVSNMEYVKTRPMRETSAVIMRLVDARRNKTRPQHSRLRLAPKERHRSMNQQCQTDRAALPHPLWGGRSTEHWLEGLEPARWKQVKER